MEWVVQCLSPVHIGTGNTIEPLDYIVAGQDYIRVDVDAFIARLAPAQAEQLASWIDAHTSQMAQLDARRDQSRGAERRQLNNQLSAQRQELGSPPRC